MKKRMISLLLALVILWSGLPMYAGAAGENEETGYQMEMQASPGGDTYTVGDTITIRIKVSSSDPADRLYSAYDLKISYDKDVLTYDSAVAADADAEITGGNGSIRVKGYGDDKPFSTAVVNLTFTVRSVGEGQVMLTQAKIDRSENAGMQNAPEAKLPEKPITIRAQQAYKVTFRGNGLAADSRVAYPDRDYSFRVVDPNLYDYTVEVVSGKLDITSRVKYDSKTGTYTIPKEHIIGDITVTATRTPKETAPTDPTDSKPTDPTKPTTKPTNPTKPTTKPSQSTATDSTTATVKVSQYLTMDGANLYLITYKDVIPQGKVPKYDGNNMYWSEKYNAYVWLLTDTAERDDVEMLAKGKVSVSEGSIAGTVNYSGNVDLSLHTDTKDVQLVRDLYNVKYTLDNMEMLKFLNADLNADQKLDIRDAAAVMKIILKSEEEQT